MTPQEARDIISRAIDEKVSRREADPAACIDMTNIHDELERVVEYADAASLRLETDAGQYAEWIEWRAVAAAGRLAFAPS